MSFPRCLIVLLAVLTAAPALAAEVRHALVIGNSKYEGEAALRNPANDADAIEATLKKLDFKVIKKSDVDIDGMEQALKDFRKSLKKGDVALFFYAGHGLQVKGENFLVPLKADPDDESQVKRKCFAVDQVIEAMNDSDSYIKVVILDCCRNNPFKRSWATRSKSEKGLSAISEIPNGTVIAFATAPGTLAADGKGANSPYTTHLVGSLNSRPKDGLELVEALKEASRAVKKETGQVPWLNQEASLDKFFLWRPTKVVESEYFPLRIGTEWEYNWTFRTSKNIYVAKVVSVNADGATIEEKRESVGDQSQTFQVREDGIYMTAAGASKCNPPRLILTFRDGVPAAKGTSWEVDYQYGDVLKIKGSAKIVDDRAKIELPIGTIEAVHIEGSYDTGPGSTKWVESFWIAKGYGIVKSYDKYDDAVRIRELKKFTSAK